MARRQTMPAFGTAWAPLTDQGRGRSRGWGRSRFGVGRWLAVGIVAGLSAALLAYVIGTDQAPGAGLSIRSWATLGLAAVALGVLVLRRRWGWRELARTLAEYATVTTLAGLLVLAAASPPVDQDQARAGQRQEARADQARDRDRERGQDRAQARPDRAASLPPVIRQVVGAGAWLAGLWRQANDRANATVDQDQDHDHGRPAGAAPPPDRTGR